MAGLEWDDLRTFLMIARHRTLSGAARALGVRQPTMGRRLEALEARAGAHLLQKTPSGYVPTEAGAAVLANVERIEAETEAVERLIAGKDISLAGPIRLTTVETLAARILAPVIADFRRIHPQVEIELAANRRSLSLTKREADVALRIAPFTQADIFARRIGQLGYGVYASAAYVAAHGAPDWARGAEGHHLILTEADLLDTPEMVWLRAAAPRAQTALASNSRLMQLAACREGMGIACLARYLGDGEPGLAAVPLADRPPPPSRPLWLGVHADLRHMPRIRAFTAALAAGVRHAAGVLDPEPS